MTFSLVVMFMMLGVLALAVVHPATHAHKAMSTTRALDTLRVVLVIDDTVARQSLLRGVRLGAEEASHTGALFGMPVTLRVESPEFLPSTPRATAARATRAPRPSLYIVAGSAGTCSAVALESARLQVPVLDAGCAPGDNPGGSTVYSLVPSRATSEPNDSTRLEAWHWSLERFGGEQLNQRYVRRFGARMDSPAWTGWIAMKIALDAALHAQASSGAALLRQLADPHAQYDGQKGRPLRFAAGTRQIVQPLYRVAGLGDAEHVVAEVEP